MEKIFCTLFPSANSVHLNKDVGFIPHYMQLYYGYNSILVSANHFPIPKSVSLSLVTLKVTPTRPVQLSVFSFLFKKSKDISILNLYHLSWGSLFNSFIYKLMNPKGISYVKMDLDVDLFIKTNQPKKGIVSFFMKPVKRFLIKKIDFFSVELQAAIDIVSETLPDLKNKIIYLPNGLDVDAYEGMKLKSFEEKEDIIITVGRIGSEQKNSGMLLQALEQIDLKHWKVYFIGPVEPAFRNEITMFFERNPGLKESVVFTDNIGDRKLLYSYFNRAKVFCLTSNWEGFPIVLTEALFFRNYLVCTKFFSAVEIISSGNVGEIIAFNEVSSLGDSLSALINNPSVLLNAQEDLKTTSQRFLWVNNIYRLEDKIKERRWGKN